MSFENELKQVFNIDIWQIKPQFLQKNSNEIETLGAETSDTVEIKATEDTKNIEIVNPLAYCNDVVSDRVINFFIDQSFNLNFLKNIIDKLFYKSKVNIYYGSSTNDKVANEKGVLVINQNDFISAEHSLLSVESKKYILEKLYQYADFKTH